ncbi:hypothetical protein JOM56_007298 [Amanita muscaria]
MKSSMKRQTNLSETLTREFCPPLDSSLIAALLVDIEVDIDGRRASPTQSQIDELRTTLRELSTQADESQRSEFLYSPLISPTDSLLDTYFAQTAASSSSRTSECSASSSDLVTSLLSFLKAAFPEIPVQHLKDALALAELENDELDLWDVISNILSDDAIRELEERGSEALDDDDMRSSILSDKVAWQSAPSKTRKLSVAKSATKTNRKHRITLSDVRQQHHLQPIPSPATPSSSAIDPWTKIVSLSEQLSDLLRSHPAAHFQSYFHSPKYSRPYEALRSALEAISDTRSELAAEDTAVFLNLLDILIPEYEGLLDSENLHSDLQLAVSVTRGHPDDALELVQMLRDLDSDSNPGRMEMAIYHSPVQATSYPPTPVSPLRYTAHVLTGPPSPPAPPDKGKGKPPPAKSESRQQSAESAWQTVCRKGSRSVKAGQKEVVECYKRRKEYLQKRNELLHEASKLWRKRNGKSRGGEVAMVLAEKARVYRERADKEALNAARVKVQAKRRTSTEKVTIDLHGTTLTEATVIVREELENTIYSPSRPLEIITGRGSHSVNKQGVLKPSIQKVLDEDGWFVSVWEGGLIVRGRKTSS